MRIVDTICLESPDYSNLGRSTMANSDRRRFLKDMLGALAGVAGTVVLASTATSQAPAGTPEPQPAAPGDIQIDQKHAKKSPAQVLKDRAKDDSQGLLGFLKTVDKKWTVVHDENDNAAKYKKAEKKYARGFFRLTRAYG